MRKCIFSFPKFPQLIAKCKILKHTVDCCSKHPNSDILYFRQKSTYFLFLFSAFAKMRKWIFVTKLYIQNKRFLSFITILMEYER